MARKMTAKQKRFCDEYLIDLNATQAALRAGYSKKTSYAIGQQILHRPECEKYIAERMAEKESELIAGQDEILKYLTAVMRGQSAASVLARNEMGADKVIDKPPDEKERLKAAELLGKRYGLFTDKIKADLEAEISPIVICDDVTE